MAKRGFTLIEVLLVLVLVGLLFASVIPRATNLFRVSVRSSVRRFGAIVRYAYDQSILTGRLHRIVLDMEAQNWAVEQANPGELPIDKARRELNPYLKDAHRGEDEEDPEEPSFKKVGQGLVGSIPKGVQIVEGGSWRTGKELLKKGQFSIYAYPNGFIDEATVVLAEAGKEDQQNFVIHVQPLTGRIKVDTRAGTGAR